MNVAVVSAFNSPAVQLRQPRCVRVAGGGTAAAASGRAGVCRAAQQQAQPAAAQQQQQDQKLAAMATSRRRVLALPAGLAAAAALAAGAGPAAAIVIPPPGYRYHVDKLDGYSFFYPADWSVVTTSGNDVQYRNPFNVEENLFVNVSSPSSSKYESVADLGSPMDAAKKLQSQFLEEFMSTRLGVKRTAEVVNAEERTGADGQLYYDIATRVKSFASRNQLAVTQAEIEEGVVLEWDRVYLTVLGVAGRRLYEFRLQAANSVYEADPERLLTVEPMQALQQVASARPLVAGRPRARLPSGRRPQVLVAALSPEQQAFLDRKAREARSSSPVPAPTRGRSASSRPASVRPTSRPAPAAAPAPRYSSSAAAPAGSLSPEQQEFLARRAQEGRSASPAPVPTRGRSGSVRPSSRTPSPVRPAASGHSAPAAAPAAGLSPEQQEFLARRAQEGRSASPAGAPTRGRSASARPASVRPTSRPAPVAAPAPSYSSSAAPSAGLTPEQQEFLARRAQEARSASPAPAPTRGRSGSVRPSSRTPSPVRPAAPAAPAASPTRGRSGSVRPASLRPSSRTPAPVRPASAAAPSSYAAPASSSAAAPAGGLSPEQQEFLARRQQESRSPPPAAAPTRGRSGSVRPSSRTPSPVRSAAASAPPPAQAEPRVGDVDFARAALERTLQTTPAVHPRDQPQTRAPPAAAPAPTGPSTGRWPDPAFFQATLQAFPAKAVCDAEEARCLMDAGYAVLDVRSELESGSKGKLRGSVMIPCVFQRQQFDAAAGQMVIDEQDNPGFLAQVARKFPRKDAPIIVMCGNGKQFSIDVLEALEEEGYVNLVGMQGGYTNFTRTFDVKLNPRDRRPVPRRQLKKLI
ncbi:domain-containing isoform A [Micractinium conductrix]|uniref:Domain-containing isoform A n=1 Tax=Micractinium conductrix TaxID=554055 RepID=A0A2P6VEF7_9CHLO|nr:domain-containing isoform A [Micractinium conductrix]|eukprot:PSC72476.1 domain-containing isoform A [Micractinium conductrix]